MHCSDYWEWRFHFVSQTPGKTFGIQEAAGYKQEEHINKHFNNFISESCTNFLLYCHPSCLENSDLAFCPIWTVG